jgi:uncharacterized protein (TIGR03435 family)
MACQRIGCSVVALSMAVTLSAQTSKPTFEVVSVKKLDQPAPFSPTRMPPRSAAFYMSNATVASLIQFAHNVRDFELIGGPDWIHRDQFEMNARAAAEVPTDETRLMVQSLLEERFRLIVRKEQREMRFFALVLDRDDGRLGPGLTKCDESASAKKVPVPRAGRVSYVRCASVSAVASLAAAILRAPVVDRTALTGLWDHVLVFEVNPGTTVSAASADSQRAAVDPNLASFPAALQEQLGLKLNTMVGPVDVLVVDSVPHPTEN